LNTSSGGRITEIRPGSVAETAGLQVGDILFSINGHLLRDEIDYRFYSADEELHIVARREPDSALNLHISREYDEDLGLAFGEPTFDGIRRCRNGCDFCFVRQMPRGLRQSLYVKDDDYRYSFLFGNFVTLTNLNEEDWMRLEEQRLSPLYVSVHATDPHLRARILGVPSVPDVLAHLRRLGALRIQVHAQIVVVPGLNDGSALEHTVNDLLGLYPTVSSVALVPVGLTRFHSCGLRQLTAAEAGRILSWLRPRQRQSRQNLGTGWVYASDEFYLMSGQRVPPRRAYDGFPQLANGVGLTRLLLDDWGRVRKRGGLRLPDRRLTLVCGTLIAPTLTALVAELAELTGSSVDVVAVPNLFFGSTVTVSGLLTAGDVMVALQGRELGDRLVLPRTMFDASGELTLDGVTPAEMAEKLRVPVTTADTLSQLLDVTLSGGRKEERAHGASGHTGQ